jgi:hypothetical protein
VDDTKLEELRPVVGTLSHNRQFEPREMWDYLQYRRGFEAVTQSSVMRLLTKKGYIERTGRGLYAPTTAGWVWINGRTL